MMRELFEGLKERGTTNPALSALITGFFRGTAKEGTVKPYLCFFQDPEGGATEHDTCDSMETVNFRIVGYVQDNDQTADAIEAAILDTFDRKTVAVGTVTRTSALIRTEPPFVGETERPGEWVVDVGYQATFTWRGEA